MLVGAFRRVRSERRVRPPTAWGRPAGRTLPSRAAGTSCSGAAVRPMSPRAQGHGRAQRLRKPTARWPKVVLRGWLVSQGPGAPAPHPRRGANPDASVSVSAASEAAVPSRLAHPAVMTTVPGPAASSFQQSPTRRDCLIVNGLWAHPLTLFIWRGCIITAVQPACSREVRRRGPGPLGPAQSLCVWCRTGLQRGAVSALAPDSGPRS